MDSDSLEQLFTGFHEFIEYKRKTRRPARIAAFLAAPTLAGFIHQNIVAAAILRRLPGASVTAFYRDDGGTRRFVADCNPYFHGEIVAEANAPMTVPLDWFDVGAAAPVKCPDPAWSERGLDRPDLLLTPKTLSTDAARMPDIQDAPPTLRLRSAYSDRQEVLLASAGLAATEWHACVDPAGLLYSSDGPALIRHIEDNLGGRVILVGESSADGLKAVNLRGHPLGIAAQTMAIATARFVIGGAGWPTAMASAFRVPVAVCGVETHETHAWNRDDLVLLAVGPEAMARATATGAADILFRRSTDAPGPRAPAADMPIASDETLSLPLALRPETALKFFVCEGPDGA